MSSTPWGVDLSPSYNPTVNAKALKDAGASYAILKVSEGFDWPAPTIPEFGWFAKVSTDIIAAGLELRTYHLGTPSTITDAQAEATWFDRHLGGRGPGQSIAYDLEDFPPGMTPAACMTIAASWSNWIHQFFPMVPREFYWNEYVQGHIAPFLPPEARIWLAHPGWRGGALLHPGVVRVQIGQRRFDGVAGNVDINVDPHASVDDIAQALGLEQPTPAPTPPKPPAPSPTPSNDWTLAVHNLDLRNAATTPVRGASVRALQTLLNLAATHSQPLVVDGVGGDQTRAELAVYQRTHGLTADMVAGPATWEALCSQ